MFAGFSPGARHSVSIGWMTRGLKTLKGAEAKGYWGRVAFADAPEVIQGGIMEATQEAPKITTQDNAAARPAANPPERKTRTNRELLDFIVETGDSGQEYARQVVQQEIAKDIFDQDWRLARVFAESNVFEDIKNISPQQAIATAMAKIQLGRNWNIEPADAMQFIYFTNGRPAVMTELFAARLKMAGYDWDFAHDYEESKDPKIRRRKCIGCTIFPKKWDPKTGKFEPLTMKRRTDSGAFEEVPLEVSFDIGDAEGAMIHEKGGMKKLSEKWNYQSWGEDMYTWRAIAKFRRRYAPHILSGALMPFEAAEIEVHEAAGQSAAKQADGTYESAQEILREKLARLDVPRGAPEADTNTQQAEESDPKPDPEPTKANGTSGGLFSEGLTGAKKK